ncbi:MAG: cytochrome c biogenesis protein CcdA [Actinobacteria bacterium]|nr:cytochrome c biogenesis protein CcdA [Actinomycetota bacterium]
MKDLLVNQILDGALLIALPISLLAGLISFLSPCVLPLVPGYLSYAAGMSKSRGRILLGSVLFISGFTALFVSYGALFGGLGSKILAYQSGITRILGFFTIALGIIFMGVFPMMPTYRPRMSTAGGLIGAPVLGFLFGVGWTPCIGPALAAVETLAVEQASALRGAILALGYSVGLGIPFILTGLFLDKSEGIRRFMTRHGNVVSSVGGVILILIGLLQVFGIWNEIMNSTRSLVSNFIPVV